MIRSSSVRTKRDGSKLYFMPALADPANLLIKNDSDLHHIWIEDVTGIMLVKKVNKTVDNKTVDNNNVDYLCYNLTMIKAES